MNKNNNKVYNTLRTFSKFNVKSIETSKKRVITKLPNSEQSSKGKIKSHKYINRQDQSTTGKL